MRLIDADALKESLKELKAEGNNRRYVQGLQDAIDDYFPQIIDDEPTIDAEPAAYIKELEEENEALKLLIEWAEECDFGYDNFPEEYESYKDEIEGMGYIEGMIHIAKRVYQQKRGESE